MAEDSQLHVTEALNAYRAELENLRPRLSEPAFRFFRDADVHDGELLQLIITDGSRPAPLNEPVRPWTTPCSYPVRAMLAVLDPKDTLIWHVSYKQVRRVAIDYPSEQPLFMQEGQGFGDWGQHELTDAGSGFLRHEILFATGASLLFEFSDVEVSSEARPAVISLS
jgi:hypothetical protein